MPKRGEDGLANDGFNLEERTARFGEAVVGFCKTIPIHPVTTVLITQCVRSGTSVGANYCEANDAESKRDFRHKIGICRKESKETKHWLRMIVAAGIDPERAGSCIMAGSKRTEPDLWKNSPVIGAAFVVSSLDHSVFVIDSSFGFRHSSLIPC
jgi:four helix bundle protein